MNKIDKLATRDAYGETLVELGALNDDIVVLDADLSGSTRTTFFAKAFPERFFNMGIAEQDMIGTAAGLACVGKIPFVSSFAMFAAGRPWEQIRNSICYPKLNVKIVSSHAGLTVGEDGASHQALEDVTIMRVLPNMRVMVPADYYETKAMIKYAANMLGPCYIRFSRSATKVVNNENYSFNPNQYPVLREGKDVAIIACGIMVKEALNAAQKLAEKQIEATVINMHTIKPIDIHTIIKYAKQCGAIVTAEEHNIIGGLAGAVAETLAKHQPTPMEMIGVLDKFGESGESTALLEKYHLTDKDIIQAVKNVIKRKV